MKILLTLCVLLSSMVVKADEEAEVKAKLKKLVLMSCIYGSLKTSEEYEKLGNKTKIKSAAEICLDILKEAE